MPARKHDSAPTAREAAISDPLVAHAPIERRQLRSASEIDAALERGASLRFVLCLEGALDEAGGARIRRCGGQGVPIRRVTQHAMRRLVPFGHDCQWLALEGPPPGSDLEGVLGAPGVVWLLVGCGYPGNAGAVIRSAEVSGAAGVVVASAFDRVERRDCLRYAMRVDRFFPVHFEDAQATVARARAVGREVIAVEDVGKQMPWEVDLTGSPLIVVGGEQAGIPQALLAEADHVIRVPMHGFLPSYNLQAAMAVVMGERLRQLSPG
ncbi:MAG: TrmH family RNA methyltransferase [Myxococcota bacterium]|jgi:TrmH family RNA methyltransferase|nr:TrmH family RNA methyltransferase [Myxococcota bacterium]